MDMQTRFHLHTGREMPVLGLGTWQLTRDTADIVADALAMGYRMIDTSADLALSRVWESAFSGAG